MGYGIIPYMISADQMNSIWGSGLSITKGLFREQMKSKLGFSFLAKQLSTEILGSFNSEIKRKHGIPDFRAHVAMQDLFNGSISYPTVPFIYSYLLKGIANELSLQYGNQVAQEFKKYYPELPSVSEDRRSPSEEMKTYYYSRTQLKRWVSSSGHLPNDQWFPCDLAIVDLLPYSTPMPLPVPEDFPYISTIRKNNLTDLFKSIEQSQFPTEAKQQMHSWFKLCIQENRDLMLFIV